METTEVETLEMTEAGAASAYCPSRLLLPGAGRCRRGGSGMKVARMCGGIIWMAGPLPLDDICPRGVFFLPLEKLIVTSVGG